MAWALDLDGVVWLSDQPIPGAAAAVAALREWGERVLFLTNNSSLTVAEYLAKLDRMGMPTPAEDLVTSAQAAAALLEPGSSALVCAGPGVDEALRARGVEPLRLTRPGEVPEAVVVGWHRDFDFARLTAASDAVRAGARLIGTNDDATYPTPDGQLPGGGAILAAVAYASGVEPVVAGKPHAPMGALVEARVGVGSVHTMVGDRPSTDGLMAQRIGARFALVLSGVTTASDLPVRPEPDEVATDLATLIASHHPAR